MNRYHASRIALGNGAVALFDRNTGKSIDVESLPLGEAAARVLNRQDTPRYTLRQVEDMAKDVGLHVAYDAFLRDSRGGPFTISRRDTWEAIASGHTLDEVAGCVQGIAWAQGEARRAARFFQLGEDQ